MLRFIQAGLTESNTPVSQAIARSQEAQFSDGDRTVEDNSLDWMGLALLQSAINLQ